MTLQTRLSDLVGAVGADIKTLMGRLTTLEGKFDSVESSIGVVAIEGWHTVGAAGQPPFGVKWQAFAGYAPQFKKLPDGTVRIRGMVSPAVSGGGAFTTVFNLPLGYRPSADIIRPGMASTTAAEILIDIRVGANGDVQFGVASSSYHTIDISFVIDQPTLAVSKSIIPVVNALPPGPTDGDEIYFQNVAMATAGIMWHLRYRAAAPGLYKWEVIGTPPPLYDEVPAAQASTSGTTWVDLATVGPQITVPLAGDYMFTGELDGYTADSASSPFVALKFGAAAVLSADRVFIFRGASATTKGAISGRSIKRTVTAANTVVKLQYSNATNSAATVTFENRTLQVRPIRVG